MLKLVRTLKNKKSSGNDQVLNEFLKYSPPKIIDMIVRLFNVILDTGISTEQWSVGIIKPLYKNTGAKDNKLSGYNYFGVIPMFPSLYAPRYLCSPVLCSPVSMFPSSMFPDPYVPRSYVTRSLCFPIPMFPSTSVPRYLCSPVGLPIFPEFFFRWGGGRYEECWNTLLTKFED